MRGGTLPLLALLLAWIGGVSQETGVLVAIWTTAVSLVAFELMAGMRAGSTPRELVLEGCVGVTMGLAILALRVILHP